MLLHISTSAAAFTYTHPGPPVLGSAPKRIAAFMSDLQYRARYRVLMNGDDTLQEASLQFNGDAAEAIHRLVSPEARENLNFAATLNAICLRAGEAFNREALSFIMAAACAFSVPYHAVAGGIEECKGFFSDPGASATVVDLDAPRGYQATGNQIFVHFTGGSKCFPPTPPFGCHRYVTVKYNDPSCLDLGDDLVGTLAKPGVFDSSGIYKKCAAKVQSTSTRCYSGGRSPKACSCPEGTRQ